MTFRKYKVKKLSHTLFFTLTLALTVLSANTHALNLDQYLETSCSEVHLKKQTEPFLKKVQDKLKSIEQTKIREGVELKNSKNVSGVCEFLGDAQFSRLLEDESLFFDKTK